MVEHTDDGRYIVVNGRRWRATDPWIPERLRKELVTELMAARRAVKAASGAEPATTLARRRVHDVKVALGERGAPWWDEPEAGETAERAGSAIRALVRKRGDASSICPSDAARVAGGANWRAILEQVRTVGASLAANGDIIVTQNGRAVPDPTRVTGPVRYGTGPRLDT